MEAEYSLVGIQNLKFELNRGKIILIEDEKVITDDSGHEDCYGTFKKLVINSKYSKSDNFNRLQDWPKLLVSYKKNLCISFPCTFFYKKLVYKKLVLIFHSQKSRTPLAKILLF